MKTKKWVALGIFVVLMGASCSKQPKGNLALKQEWYANSFGQSVDVNFNNSANEPGQNGINNVWINPTWNYADPIFIQDDAALTQVFKNGSHTRLKASDVIVVESRGGKMTGSHDGMTFFYTRMPANRNFIMSAEITLEAAGPHPLNRGHSGSPVTSFNNQGAAGLIARDVVGIPRQETLVVGFEELPAVANFAAVGVNRGTVVDENTRFMLGGSLYRDGLSSLVGNVSPGLQGTRSAEVMIGTPYIYVLERTDEGFFATINHLDGSEFVPRSPAGEHDSVLRISEKEFFVGIGAMREVRVSARNIELTDTGANTAARTPLPVVTAQAQALMRSPALSLRPDHTLAILSTVDGEVSIYKADTLLHSAKIEAVTELYLPIELTQGDNAVRVLLKPANGTKDVTLNQTIIYTPLPSAQGSAVYASPAGNGNGTQGSPASLAQALVWLQPGQTLYLASGTYTAAQPLLIDATNGGLPNAPKTVQPAAGALVIIRGSLDLRANHWVFRDLTVGGTAEQRTAGNVINILGSYNTFERMITEYGGNTGLNIGNVGTNRALFPRHNQVINSTSRYNVDAAGNNADGFAAKRVGPGNLFYGNIAYGNVDDGWDLFNPIDAGASAPVTITHSIAYNNGTNGFKLGGEAQPANHIVNNNLSFNNGMAGFSDNFNPGALMVSNNTSVDNKNENFIFRDNPFIKPANELTNNLSFRTNFAMGRNDSISGTVRSSALQNNGVVRIGNHTVVATDFISLTAPESYNRAGDGSILWGDFMRLSPTSPLNTAGASGSALGPETLY